jgi:hypothetical protein
MPIYNSYISAVPGFRRIGHHVKSPKTNSSTSLFAPSLEAGEMYNPTSKRKFSSKVNFEFPLGSKSCVKSTADSCIGMKIESPPLVFYGSPKDSTGALLSGLIHIKNEDKKQWESFTLELQVETLARRPVHGGCAKCAVTVDTINTWTFISKKPTDPNREILTYPFSYLLPGHLPATNDNSLTRISYSLVATGRSVKGDELHFKQPLTVERAILPGPDRHSVRIFPPTNLSATVQLPSVVHPGGDFLFDVRLDGVVNKEKSTRWRLRKLNWRIDENSRAISPACKHHSAKLGGSGKGIVHEDVRTVGAGEMKCGWKSDFEVADGKIELEVTAGIPVHSNAACQLESSNGATVDHVLVVEMVVAEEHRPGPNKLVTPTGAARVLRMQFKLVVTGRSGLGISWDEEAPPVYENVPASPPEYGMPDASPELSYADFPPLVECSSVESRYLGN